MLIEPQSLIGTFRRFGAHGPAYEIVATLLDDMMKIKVVNTGEELEYPVMDILDDPKEH